MPLIEADMFMGFEFACFRPMHLVLVPLRGRSSRRWLRAPEGSDLVHG